MKYFRRLIYLLVAVWLVMLPFVSRAGADSALYGLKVKLNDPIFTFFQITAEARGESHVSNLNNALSEYVKAVVAKDTATEAIAKDAFTISWNRVRGHAKKAEQGGNLKVADEVRARVLGLMLGHKEVLRTLSNSGAISKNISDFDFLEELKVVAARDRSVTVERFENIYEKVELVKGVDDRIRHVSTHYNEVLELYRENISLMQENTKISLERRLEASSGYISNSKDLVSKDLYVGAYVAIDNADGILHEIEVLLEGVKHYNAQVEPQYFNYDEKKL